MKRIVTAAEMRAVDAAAPGCGVSSLELMERAGVALGRAALLRLQARGRVLVFCGSGNNGGDGLVAARWLHAQGQRVVVALCGSSSKASADFTSNLARLRQAGVPCWPSPLDLTALPGDVVVDALFGTGLSRPLDVAAVQIVNHINHLRASGAWVLSADLPSGTDSDTGAALGAAVQADLTLTFGLLKPALIRGPVEVADIGLPEAALATLQGPRLSLVEEADVRSMIHARRHDGHKGTFGHVLVFAGSQGKTGAASLCARAGLRVGAGLVSLIANRQTADAVLATAAELMAVVPPVLNTAAILSEANARQAFVVGPGLERLAGVDFAELLAGLSVPTVIDAEGLNIVAEAPAMLRRATVPLILTPHPKEMARLCGLTVAEVQASRVSAARDFAAKSGAIVVLKGAGTVIALPNGEAFINPTGNAGMATGGTGDVLAGLIGGLLAQGLDAKSAALAGVFIHGLAGDLISADTGQQGLIASDLLSGVQRVWARWHR